MPALQRAEKWSLLDACFMDLEGITRCGLCGGNFIAQELAIIGFDNEGNMDQIHVRISLTKKLYRSIMECSACSRSASFVISNLTGLPLYTPIDNYCTMNNSDARTMALNFVKRYSTVWAKGKKLEQEYLGHSVRVKDLEDLGCPKASHKEACFYHQPTGKPTHCAFCDVVSYINWFHAPPQSYKPPLPNPPMLFLPLEE
jgi:hypothetical protein